MSRRVVIGVDDFREAEAAAEFLLLLSLPEETHATVVSVVPPLPYGQGLVKRRANMTVHESGYLGVEPREPSLLSGPPWFFGEDNS